MRWRVSLRWVYGGVCEPGDVEMILHAGDIGNREVLDTLNEIAPVVAVRGNNDKGEWAQSVPEWEVVEIGDVSIYMLHDL